MLVIRSVVPKRRKTKQAARKTRRVEYAAGRVRLYVTKAHGNATLYFVVDSLF